MAPSKVRVQPAEFVLARHAEAVLAGPSNLTTWLEGEKYITASGAYAKIKGLYDELQTEVLTVPREISFTPVDGGHATRTYEKMHISTVDENTKKMHEVLTDRIEKKYIFPPPDKNSCVCIIGDPMQNPEEVLGPVRKAAAQTVFEDDVKSRQAYLRSMEHPRYPVTPFMATPDSTAARDGSPPVTKKRATTGFAAMLATPQGGKCDEEWDEYYRICKDKDYLGQANVGGAVDSDGVPLEPGNPPRFCLFTWIAVIEGVCPAVALTLRAAFSAQATSTAVERTFSQAGLSSGQLRTDLKSDTLCRHIYLRMNEEHLPSLDEACEEYCNRHGHKHAKEAGGGSSSAVV